MGGGGKLRHPPCAALCPISPLPLCAAPQFRFRIVQPSGVLALPVILPIRPPPWGSPLPRAAPLCPALGIDTNPTSLLRLLCRFPTGSIPSSEGCGPLQGASLGDASRWTFHPLPDPHSRWVASCQQNLQRVPALRSHCLQVTFCVSLLSTVLLTACLQCKTFSKLPANQAAKKLATFMVKHPFAVA